MKKNKLVSWRLLMLLCVCSAQPSPAQEPLLQKFNTYRENNLQEKLYVHTDRTFYVAGEICWFKVYAVDAFFHQPLNLSKLVYAELLDKNNKPVLQAKIAMDEGNGNGSFQLPVAMATGVYKLRAYTNWMKNAGPEYFFEQTLTVVNTRAVYPAAALQKERYQLQFFPEGGNMVNGIKSRVAFRLLTAGGRGVAGNGMVLNEKGDTIVSYNTVQFGMGSFWLTPGTGHRYRGVMQLPDGSSISEELPVPAAAGYVMRLESADEDHVAVNVQYTGALTAPEVFLFVHTRNSVKSIQQNTLQNGVANFSVDKKKLGGGITHFTVFNATRQPVCERLYFTYPQEQLLPVITTDAGEYGTRRKVTVQVSTRDQLGQMVGADMSMAVYRLDSLQRADQADISSYLWLTADLGGNVESPAWYFTGSSKTKEDAMDNLMLTNGWRRFRWDDILEEKKPGFTFVPEYEGHIITGKIVRAANGLPGNNIGGYLAVPGTNTRFRNAVSGADGHIKFLMKDFYNEGEIIVQTDNLADSAFTVEVQQPFSEQYTAAAVQQPVLPSTSAPDLEKHSTAMQVQNEYHGAVLKQFRYPDTDTGVFYGKPDVTYLLDNYVRFTTMEEVLREYVMPVNVRKRNGQFHLPVYDELARAFFVNDPLLLLDGVPVFSIDRFMEYDPLKIKKLEVVSRRYFLGDMFFEGIVNFITYKGNLEGYELDPHATVIDYEGLQRQRIFYAPEYETPQQLDSHLPDFRNLLYWSPSVKTGIHGRQDINFYTSDIAGRYLVVLQGLTADGKTGAATAQFDVKETPAFTNK